MPEAPQPKDRTPAQREADHASLLRLSETLVPALVQKLNAGGLGELEVREGDWRIRLRRPMGIAPAAPGARRPERVRPALHAQERHGPDRDGRDPRDGRPGRDGAATEARIGVEASVLEGPDTRRAYATSPAVGVFRPSAKVGAVVAAGDRIAIVDLLGIPQDVTAPIDGTLVEILVEAGNAVEYGEQVAVVEAAPRRLDEPDPDGAAGASGEA